MHTSKLIDNDTFWQEIEQRQAAIQAEEHREKEAATARLKAERLAAIPARYHEPFKASLSKVDRKALDHCINWHPDTCQGQGIGLFGSSGLGKTRLLCRLLFRLECSWLYLPAYQFSEAVTNQFSDQYSVAGDAVRALRAAHRVRVLFLDDIGDEKHTDSVSSALKGLIEHRTSRKLPTLWTSNLSDEQIAAKHGERGPAIVRRLAEFSWTP